MPILPIAEFLPHRDDSIFKLRSAATGVALSAGKQRSLAAARSDQSIGVGAVRVMIKPYGSEQNRELDMTVDQNEHSGMKSTITSAYFRRRRVSWHGRRSVVAPCARG